MSGNNMSLKNLTMFDFSEEKLAAHGAKVEAEIQEYKAKYGEDWEEYWHAANVRKQDIVRRRVLNRKIYDTGRLAESRYDRWPESMQKAFDLRLREVYGDQYDVLVSDRVDRDPRVAELLIQDALRTGEWEALPEELLDAYHKRVGDKS